MTDEISDRYLQSYISGRLRKQETEELETRLQADEELRARLHNLRLQQRLVGRLFGTISGPEDPPESSDR